MLARTGRKQLRQLVVAGVVVSGVTGCAALNNLAPGAGGVSVTPPTVTFISATLAQAPGQRDLAGYYCPDVVSIPFGGAGPLCQGFFGPRPAPAQMVVAFDLRFSVQNPNRVPLPMANVLTAVTVFPDAGAQKLGAVCVQLCPAGQTACSGQPEPGACEASSRDIRSLSDFGAAAANLLVAGGLAAAAGQPLTFTAPTVAAGATLDVTVRFSFGPEQLLATLRHLAEQSAGELKRGQQMTFSIPYRLEGTAFFDAGSLGRIAVPFGPTSGNRTPRHLPPRRACRSAPSSTRVTWRRSTSAPPRQGTQPCFLEPPW